MNPTIEEKPIQLESRHYSDHPRLNFELPRHLEANEPPEARGLGRDQVRMLVSRYRDNTILHTKFKRLPDFLNPGDVVVINTSGTRKAALDARGKYFSHLKLHLSTHLPDDTWVVELREVNGQDSKPYYRAQPDDVLDLPATGRAWLLEPHQQTYNSHYSHSENRVRLWRAKLLLPMPLEAYLDRYGTPIRYGYVKETWPISYYQTVYATETGSAEMPSAGRPFSHKIITKLIVKGIDFAPLLLHSGVASLKAHEAPYEEVYQVPQESADKINAAKSRGYRIIAVGTTSVRAIETVTDENGKVQPGNGWTHLVITPQRGLRVIEGLITGFHEPKASHLNMLAALTSKGHIEIAYREAIQGRYLWHEFGDIHLILR